MPVAPVRARATRAPEAPTHAAAARPGRWRVPRDDRGSSSVEFTILFPIIVILLFGGPQLAMWYFARESAQAAATSAARAASVVSATPGDGKTAAETYLARVGSDTITGGAGADHYVWMVDAPLHGNDVITDFDPLQDSLEFYDPYGGSKVDLYVGSSADGDVQFSWNGGTVELNGVQNQGWTSVQQVQDAGIDVTWTQVV